MQRIKYFAVLMFVTMIAMVMGCGGKGGTGGNGDNDNNNNNNQGFDFPEVQAASSDPWILKSYNLDFMDVAGGDNGFLAVGSGVDGYGVDGYGYFSVFYSENGNDWREVASLIDDYSEVAYSDGLYLIASSEQTRVSADGEEWTIHHDIGERCELSGLRSVLPGPEGYAFLVFSWGSEICHSNDGVTWEQSYGSNHVPQGPVAAIDDGEHYHLVDIQGKFYELIGFGDGYMDFVITNEEECDLLNNVDVTDAVHRSGVTYLVTWDGTIISTQDFGLNCNLEYEGGGSLYSVTDAGALGLAAVGEGGTVLVSTGGGTWTLRNVGDNPFVTLRGLAFVEDTIVAVGESKTIMNGGGSGWELVDYSDAPKNPQGVAHISQRFIVAGQGAHETSDGGDNWNRIMEESPGGSYNSIAAKNDTVVMIGNDVRIATDINNGWNEAHPSLSLSKVNKLTAWGDGYIGVGGKGLVFTTDDFEVFSLYSTPVDESLVVSAADDDVLLTASDDGSLLSCDLNNEERFCEDITSQKPGDDLYVHALATDGAGEWIGVIDGNIYRSSDPSQGWNPEPELEEENYWSGAVWTGERFVAVGAKGFILNKVNEDPDWQYAETPAEHPRVEAVSSDGKGGLFATAYMDPGLDTLWWSEDHGENWVEIEADDYPYSGVIYDRYGDRFIAFSNAMFERAGYGIWDGTNWESFRGQEHGRWQSMVGTSEGLKGFIDVDPEKPEEFGPFFAEVTTPGNTERGIRVTLDPLYSAINESGDLWIAIDDMLFSTSKQVASSEDGVTWGFEFVTFPEPDEVESPQGENHPAFYQPLDLIFGENEFLILATTLAYIETGGGGGYLIQEGPRYILKSSDGKSWTRAAVFNEEITQDENEPLFFRPTNLAYGENTYTAVGSGFAATSTDGENWDLHIDSYSAFGSYKGTSTDEVRRVNDIIFDGRYFVAVGLQWVLDESTGVRAPASRVWRSNDGVEWDVLDPELGFGFRAIASDAEGYLALDSSGRIVYRDLFE